jgi:cobalt-zinc-cadmium efflux system outer membrane protein
MRDEADSESQFRHARGTSERAGSQAPGRRGARFWPRFTVNRAWSLILALSLPSCASMQKERGHEDVSRIVQRRSGYGTGWERGTPEDRQIAARVSKLLAEGLTRERAVSIALINNPRLQQTYESLDVSQADLVQAGLLSNPSVGGSVGFRMNGPGRSEFEVSVVQSFLDLFMLPLKKRVAEQQFVTATLRVAHEALDTVSEVSKVFAEVQAGTETVRLMQSITDAAQAAADLSQRLFDAGNVTERTLASQRAEYEQAELELARAQLSLLEDREKLTRMLGLWGPETEWTLAQRLPALPDQDPVPEHLERTAMKQRLDLAAAKRELALFDSALSLAKSSRYTGIVDVGAHLHQDPDGAVLFGPTLSLELPIFDQRQALIGRLEAQRRQAQHRVDELAIAARSEVRLATAKLELTRRAAERYKQALLPIRATVLEQAQLEYNAMQIGLFELLAAKQGQIAAARAYIETVRDYWIARAELERALGGRLPASSAAPAKPNAATAPSQPSAQSHAHGAQ